jgi:hypothetical protein
VAGLEWPASGLLYRFDAPLCFANADVLRDQIRELVREAEARCAR